MLHILTPEEELKMLIGSIVKANTNISIDEALIIIGKQEIEKFELTKQRDQAINSCERFVKEFNRLTEQVKKSDTIIGEQAKEIQRLSDILPQNLRK